VQTESHSAPTPSERVTGRLAVRLALQAVDVETARAWHRSVEYAMALEVRDQGFSRNLILVEGVAPA
jgi:uncharacterized protein (DUF1330 family)